jgi:hypothetical protein
MQKNYDNSFEDEVKYLKNAFDRAVWNVMTKTGFDNSKGTFLYDCQVEYCYLIDSIERDSFFIAKKQLPKIRELIKSLREFTAESGKDNKD